MVLKYVFSNKLKLIWFSLIDVKNKKQKTKKKMDTKNKNLIRGQRYLFFEKEIVRI